MHRKFLFVASLVLVSTVKAQTPQRALMSYTPPAHSSAGTLGGGATGRLDAAPVLRITGERALLVQVENVVRPAEPASFTGAPVDGSRALLGRWPSALAVGAGGAERRSSFRTEVRGDVTSDAWGEAEFGAVPGADDSAGAFVVSLGVCGQESAILFTRRSGAPLDVGRYRISADANGEDEILALVLTGSPTRPSGAFRGESGSLVVTAVSERLITARYQFDAIGFLAAEPQREDRRVNVTGSLSATTASSSFRVCENPQ